MTWEKRNTITCAIFLIMLGICHQGYGQDSVMTHLSYRSDINHRYAVTWVTANMENPSDNATEILFKITLPKTAFISGLIMEIDGRNYTSRVEEKKKAQAIFNEAQKQGVNAGLVKHSGTTEQKFEVSTNVEAKGKVIFYLKYEELLLRSKGKYTQNIQIKPGVNPSKLDITVNIKESEEIMGLKIVKSPLGVYTKYIKSSLNGTHVQQDNPNHAVVSYHSQGPEGLYGELTLKYDVKREIDAGEMMISDGYFVHFFSPDGLEKMAAHTVFILDVSGSMIGNKLDKLKESMKLILDDLQPEDSFELLTFSNSVDSLGIYNKNNPNDMELANEKISNLEAGGGTNMHDALVHGFKNALKSCQISANQVVFLTDGRASTVGILNHVQEINTNRIPLYSLAFGNAADFRFLSKISFHNRGFARMIPLNSSTEEILLGFYQEIGTPLMADIDIKYPEDAVNQTTIVKNGWSTLQKGNEIIVAGQMKQGKDEVHPKIDGIINTGLHQFKVPRISKPIQLSGKENFIGHLWAYLTIQDLTNTADITDDTIEKEELNARALSLALKYKFVTKLTSLVVVRPGDLSEEEENISLLPVEDSQEGQGGMNSPISSAGSLHGGAPRPPAISQPMAHYPYPVTESVVEYATDTNDYSEYTTTTMPSYCEPVCKNGRCISTNTCSCSYGWTGEFCDIPDWTQLCRNGQFISSKNCSCSYGWTGEFCDIPVCEPVCKNGRCVSPNTCSCSYGWTGKFCDIAKCNGCMNGQCVSPFTCSCSSGWTGRRCDTPVCDSECMNGHCVSPNNCSCSSGWTGELCDIRICDPNCVMGHRVSPNNCSCSSGWIGQHCDKRCPNDYFTSSGTCYKVFEDKKLNWQDAKSKCSSEGMEAASKPSDPVGLRKYIIDNYDVGTLVWLDAQGAGSQYIWMEDNSTLSFSDPLWASGEPISYRRGDDSCLYLSTWKIDFEKEPESPFAGGRCVDKNLAFALCERLNKI